MGGAYWRLGRKHEAIASWEKALSLRGGFEAWAMQRLAEAYWNTGRTKDARLMVERLEEREATGYVEPVVLARAYSAVGRTEAALVVLERAFQKRDLDPQRMRGLADLLGREPREPETD